MGRQGAEECKHRWRKDGEFRQNRQMWFGEKAHVTCVKCNVRTWFSPEQWKAANKENA